ncbi:MAG: hypothetical protein HRF43_18490 [Phycisphaerae bacterium]|jgi:hypothetical protein
MAVKPPPTDREAMAALQKLKSYNNYKAAQMQKPPGAPGDADLQTVEAWAADAQDTGAAWGEKKQRESDQQVKDADAWSERARKDDEEAAAERDFFSKMDFKKFRDDLKKKIEEYVSALQSLGEAGEPGFKGKAAEAKAQSLEARQFLDEKFEKTLKDSAKANADARRQRKAVAEAMQKKGEEGKQWQKEYGGQPGKFPAGQRADVEAALDRIKAKAEGLIADLQPFGARAAAHVEALKGVQAWAARLKPLVGSQGKELASAKELGKSGSASARKAFANVEAFQDSQEADANESLEIFQRWTDENNRLAREWINCPSAKHRAWAQEWLKTQGG